ncbi:GtrA family protein [uncultured Friedmanniella sp.]|uniref:GtrA family protein n=1 Tax=uncultured Friedmanniella sp. TaxID=335381 RepID=UPI0035CAE099
MERLKHYLFVRHGHNWVLLFRFGLVGGSGVLVNLLVSILLKRSGPHFDDVFLNLPLTSFNVRWYHVYSMLAFLVANLWNFQLNRRFTFRSAKHSGWWREYAPFLAVGLAAQLVGLGILTLLMHPGSFLSLPSDVFDNSSGLRTKFYWAQLIVIAITVPISFVLNKVWTFSAVRGGEHPSLAEEAQAEEAEARIPGPTSSSGSTPG